jgi:hypothetical protein
MYMPSEQRGALILQDPLAAYDVSVAEEGAALEEYLALIRTAAEQTGSY